MPVRTENGLVHSVLHPATRAWYGLTACQMLYQQKGKSDPWTLDGGYRGATLHGVELTNRRPTCVICVANTFARLTQ